MNRLKSKTKVYVTIALGLFFLSFASLGFAVSANSNVHFRSIEDWLLNNPGGSGNFINEEYVINLGNPFNFPILQDEIFLVNGETTYDGYVREKVLSEDRTEVFVHLNVKNAPMTVYSFSEFLSYLFWYLGIPGWPEVPPPAAIIGAYVDGYMDYTFKFKFIRPTQDTELPSFTFIYNNYEVVSSQLTGTGYGIFTDNAATYDFTPEEKGKVFVNQLMLSKPQLEGLKINKLYDTELWPVEIINVK